MAAVYSLSVTIYNSELSLSEITSALANMANIVGMDLIFSERVGILANDDNEQVITHCGFNVSMQGLLCPLCSLFSTVEYDHTHTVMTHQ